MADRAAHVTMLQRSPSYVLSLPAEDPFAEAVRRRLPPERAYPIVRWKNVVVTTLFFELSRRAPGLVRRLIRRQVEAELDGSHPADPHFAPTYDPWDQRVCLVPDGDLFAAVRSGRASVVTDRIETFTERGIRLASGDELEADVVVTATGLNLLALGGMRLEVDGEPVRLPEKLGYKGMMLSDVPNFVMTLGYTNASWTLKADLTSAWLCRLLNHMAECGAVQATPRNREPDQPTAPFIDLQSGYVQRSIHEYPRQGAKPPWRLHQNYARDLLMLRRGPLEDGALELRGPVTTDEFRPAAASALT
jgi:cation diffusion facilitator CzcD-associated flavoprotein CzcO